MNTTTAIPAATLILFRETEMGVVDHLFVERSATMVFAAGALVFPGGRVDDDDRLIAQSWPNLDPEDAAARVAAIRETVEEAGIGIGFEPVLSEQAAQDLRVALADGTFFSTWLTTSSHSLDLEQLVPFARWRPNFRETRSFDARFYIARVPPETHEATVDTTENVHLFWSPARRVLERAELGDAHVIFPTMRNLERLAELSSFEDALSHLAEFPSQLIVPFVETRRGFPYLCIPDGAGYPITARPLADEKRG
jgi:8-oxo-dGTP pyrophosphatase MutT (NUDIX family)